MIRVTCAVILRDSRILVTQRGPQMSLPLKWEFPGGKIEAGENEEDCILREIKEELNIEIKLLQRLESNIHNYENFSIELIPFLADYISGHIVLQEHMEFRWLTVKELSSLDWASADIPIVENVIKLKT